MVFHDLGVLGTADVVAKKSLSIKINMPWERFALKFAAQIADLSTGTIAVLQEAIISKKDIKIKKEGDELDSFFERIEAGLQQKLCPNCAYIIEKSREICPHCGTMLHP